MKLLLPFLPCCFAASFALGLGDVLAQTIGSHEIKIFGSGEDAVKYTPISVGLVNAEEFSGTIETVSATGITLAGAPLTAGAWDDGFYYISITDLDGDGDMEDGGAWTSITANTEDSIQLVDDITAFAVAGSKFVVRKHVTIGEIFGPNNEFGLQAADNLAQADNLVILTADGVDTLFYQVGGFGSDGWKDSAGKDMTDYIIPLGQGIQVKRWGDEDVVGIFAGFVKMEPTIVTVRSGWNVMQVVSPTGLTLEDSGLLESGFFGGYLAEADNLITLSETGWLKTLYYSGDGGFVGPQWEDGAAVNHANYVLRAGTGFLINRKNRPRFLWKVPGPPVEQK